MKLLRKINKGLILTILVVAILAVYLVNVEAKRNEDKPFIEEACKAYIEFTNEYVAMPEEYQKLYSEEEYIKEVQQKLETAMNDYLNKCEEGLKERLIDNETAIALQKSVISSALESNTDATKSITTKFTREITKIKKYTFEDDQVTVIFNSTVEKETKYLELDEETLEYQEKTSIDSFELEDETIILKKENGEWKIVGADLTYEDYDNVFYVF